MAIYNIQDNDRPMWVVAGSWEEALKKWEQVIRKENDIPEGDKVDGPQGIQFVADDNEVIL